jgi:diguanylate cyclase (GGDEF)-like protein/PAS domain S-box-containing protein
MGMKRDFPADEGELRRQAEAEWRERKKREAGTAVTEADMLQLVHELEVHQIELEMQNEELRRVQDELEESRARYFDLYDLAPIGYLTLDGEGHILEANLTAASLLGIEKGQLLENWATYFFVREDLDVYRSHHQKLFKTGEPQVCELRIRGKDGLPIWVQLDWNLARDEATRESLCRVMISDITARREAEEKLRFLSTHDALTGLYSHGFFMEEMARLERGREFPVSIVMADVDDLKETNNREGHGGGDALLKRVAKILIAAFRAEDVIARIGGDEFAVLLPATDVPSGEAAVRRMRRVIEETNTTQPEAPIHLSIGVSTAEQPASLMAILKKADANMYREKRRRD